MRHVLRRAIGFGGAAIIAVAMAVIPALHADAATAPVAKFTGWGIQCGADTIDVFVNLEHYAKTPDSAGNTFEIADDSGNTVIPLRHFGDFADESFGTSLRGDQPHTLTMTIHAQDDPDGAGAAGTATTNQWDGTFTDTFGPCTGGGPVYGNGPRPNWTTTCDPNGRVTVDLNLRKYFDVSGSLSDNTVVVTDTSGNVVIPLHDFLVSDSTKSTPMDGSVAHEFQMTIVAPADFTNTNGNGSADQFDGTFHLSSKPCQQPVSSTTAPPPTGTTTTRPVLAQAGSSGGPLPDTGVNAGFPLLIAGSLVAIGGAVLLWTRRPTRRRTD